jgi:hypothetical protein
VLPSATCAAIGLGLVSGMVEGQGGKDSCK